MGGLRGRLQDLDRFCFAASANETFARVYVKQERTTYPWVRNTPRLHQDNFLQELDSGKLHTRLGIGCPHELDDPALRTRERVPLWSFVSARAPVRKRRGSISANGVPKV